MVSGKAGHFFRSVGVQSPLGRVPAVTGAKRILLALACVMVMAAAAGAENDQAQIKYRQDVMRAVGGNMAAIARIVKGKLPHEDNIVVHARQLWMAGPLIESAFENKTTDGQTDSKPRIWTQWDDFLAKTQEMGVASSKLAELSKSGDLKAIGSQMRTLAKTCGACHREYRKPKSESYKIQD